METNGVMSKEEMIKFCEEMLEETLKTYNDDLELICCVFSKEGNKILGNFSDAKDIFIKKVKEIVVREKAYAVFTIMDCWFYEKSIFDKSKIVRPGEHPQKKEAIVGILDMRTNKTVVWKIPILRGNNNEFSFGKREFEESEFGGGRINFFDDSSN